MDWLTFISIFFITFCTACCIMAYISNKYENEKLEKEIKILKEKQLRSRKNKEEK